MIDPLQTIAKVMASFGGGHVRRTAAKVRMQALEYQKWPDERLKDNCINLFSGRGRKGDSQEQRRWLRRLINAFLLRRFDPLVVEAMALGIEVFRRAPADLPRGSYLYPQQVEAAVALTQRCVIQMDTGEGKTYALLPAALALASRYPRVYVLCANEYLAERDATRTVPFWRFVGLPVSLAIEGTPEEAWSAPVIYTTLREFMFKRLNDQNAYEESPHPMTTGAAVLIDEADAVLIDAAFHSYQQVTRVRASSFDWAPALELAAALDPQAHVLTDTNPLRANLTVQGELFLRDRLGAEGIDEPNYLNTRHTVELAYLASRVVKEGVHYIREEQSLFIIDPLTGRIDRHVFPSWLTPLAFIKGLPQRPPALIQDTLWPTSLLAEFPHLAAMSGTVAQDAVEYFFSYNLRTHIIPPRVPRVGKVYNDLTFLKAERAFVELSRAVDATVKAGQPVLVATQTIDEAERFYRIFCHDFDATAAPDLLTGKNDDDAATFFMHAGEPGKVTIATQLAGRGVDIRLSSKAKAAGGMALFGLGHAPTVRHDRQLMGRVGRQGDPFTIQFVNSLDDSFMARFSDVTAQILRKLGLQDEVIDHVLFNRAIHSAQSRYARDEFYQRRHASQLSTASSESRARFFGWFDACRVVDSDPNECSRYFVDMILEHFVDSTVTPVIRGERELSRENAQGVLTHLAVTLKVDEERLSWLCADDLVGHSAMDAAQVVRERLSAELRRVFAAAAQRRKEALLAYFRFRATAQRQEEVRETACETFNTTPSINTQLAPSALEDKVTAPLLSPPALDGGEDGSATAITDAQEAADEDSWTKKLISPMLLWRTPRRIAYAVLRLMWGSHIEELDRLNFQIAMGGHTPINRYRLLRERSFRAQQQGESRISGCLVAALLRADVPEHLDQLFLVIEHAVAEEKPTRASRQVAWQPGIEDTEWRLFDRSTKREDIIHQFIRDQAGQLVSQNFREGQLLRLLVDFTQQSPFTSLKRPDMIHDALREWFTLAKERGVGRADRQQQKQALRAFLVYLRERNLVGLLPSFQDRVVATGRRLGANLSGFRVALPLLGIALFTAIFAGLSHVSLGAAHDKLTGIVALTDNLLFGGALVTGSMSGLIIGTLATGCIAATIMQPQVDMPAQITGLGKFLFWLLLAAVVVRARVFDMDGGGTLSWILKTCLAVAIMFVLGEVMRAWLSALHADTGLSFLSLWLAYTSFGVLAFNLAGLSGDARAFLATFAGGVVLLYIWSVISSCELTLLSQRLTTETFAGGEKIYTSAQIRGHVGVGSHALGVLTAWSVIEVMPSQLWIAHRWQIPLVAFSIYFIVTAMLIYHQLTLRLAPQRWQIRLNEMHQVFVEQDWGTSLEEALRRVRAWLYRRELLLLLLLSAGFGCMAASFFGVSPKLANQLGLFGLLGAVVFAACSTGFATELYRFVFNQGTVMPVTFETSRLRDSSEDEEFLERLKRYAENRVIAVVSLLVVLLNTADAIRSFVEWITKLWKLH